MKEDAFLQQEQPNEKVHVLLAVWGETFINTFLALSLPSLLAPGNIPALARSYKTKFVFLTRTRDISVFEKNPIFHKLRTICEIEFISLDDLIVFGNYSTTLTLAFDRAIRSTGKAMLNTYFVFLTSDYIMADGSLEGLVRYIKKGYSGICAGNFQVTQKEMEPFLFNRIDPATQVMAIPPRELLKESFKNLHPVVIASLYDQKIVHNYHANRFFLQYSHEIMAGRFYLLHMLCIKPETMDYRVGASCDYSFIPEMCPSGNIGIINDSDDYLVIEVQPEQHELNFVHFGAYDKKKLVSSLAEWTTQKHRHNADHTIFFHTRDIAQTERAAIEKKLETFVGSLAVNLQKYPAKPYYNHPYWVGALDAFTKHRRILEKDFIADVDRDDCDYVDLTPVLRCSTPMKRRYYKLFGFPLEVFRWNYRWREYRLMMNVIRQYVTPSNAENTIVLYSSHEWYFSKYFPWLKGSLKIARHYLVKNLVNSQAKLAELQKKPAEVCLLLLSIGDLKKTKTWLARIKPLLKPFGKVVIIIPNEANNYPNFIYDFRKTFVSVGSHLVNTEYVVTDVTTIHNNLTLLGAMTIDRIEQSFSYKRSIRFFFFVLCGFVGSVFSLIRHCLPIFSNSKKGHCTNIVVTLTPAENVGGNL